jgi:hypothetical protein
MGSPSATNPSRTMAGGRDKPLSTSDHEPLSMSPGRSVGYGRDGVLSRRPAHAGTEDPVNALRRQVTFVGGCRVAVGSLGCTVHAIDEAEP